MLGGIAAGPPGSVTGLCLDRVMNAKELAPRLPSPADLRGLGRRIVLLEYLIDPDSEFRQYAHTAEWRPGWDLITMRNGGGDDYAIALSDEAGLLRGFDHESEASPYTNEDELSYLPGTVDALPERFRPFLEDSEFTDGDEMAVSLLLWFLPGETTWRTEATGEVEDGADWLLGSLVARDPAREFHKEFQGYYETSLDLSAVRAVLDGTPLTEEIVAGLNPEADEADLLRRATTFMERDPA